MRGWRGTAAMVAVVAATGCTAQGTVVALGHRPAPASAASTTPSATTVVVSPSPGRVTVDGIRVSLERASTVAAALSTAHVRVPDGQVLALRSHRSLGSDGRLGRVLVDGHVRPLTATLSAGDVVTTVAGADRVEPTRVATVRLVAPNPANLYVGAVAGAALARVGVRSGETVVTKVLRAPTLGHLVTPGAVVLTFDDGPDSTWTPRVLALLAQAKVHAVFCEIGVNVARHPDVVRDVVAAGNLLCDHTWDHDEQLRVRPPGEIALDISRGADAITRAAGSRPAFFRAPGGNWSPTIEADARQQHMTPLKWTVDPRDWSRPGVTSILSTVYAEVRPGGVILMHDGGGDRSETVAALRVLLKRLPAMGYHFVLPRVHAA